MSETEQSRVLVVVYDEGSVGPARIACAAEANDCEVIFVMGDSDHAREMRPALEAFGTVIEFEEGCGSELLRSLIDLRPAGILTFSEYQIGYTAELGEALELRYHATKDVAGITRKDEQRRLLASADVEVLRARAITAADEVVDALSCVGLPAIVKPVLGASSRHTIAVSDATECHAVVEAFLEQEPALLLEELLIGRSVPAPWGDYIAVDCVASGGDVAPIFVTSKFCLAEPFRERGGYGARSIVSEAELRRVEDLACRAIRALNIRDGIADVELKLTATGPRIIEVNGRLGGWVDELARRANAADPVDLAIRAALGVDIEPPGPTDGPIAFHYVVVPPLTATTVRSVHDSARLARLPNVERVTIHARPGVSTDWRIGAPGAVAAVAGATDSHEDLAQVVNDIEDLEWIVYD